MRWWLGKGDGESCREIVTHDSVNLAAFVALREAFLLVLAGAQLAEVFGCSGDGRLEEVHLNAAEGFSCDGVRILHQSVCSCFSDKPVERGR